MSAFEPAWQAGLLAEYEAVFAYSVLGPRLSPADQPRARDCQAAHEAVRDAVTAAMTAAGITPAPAPADDAGLSPLPSPAAALALAARIEDDCATAWRAAYAMAAAPGARVTDGLVRRREAQGALSASAVRAARWRKIGGVVPASRPFPGI